MQEMRIALRNLDALDPWSLASYEAAGGYQALAKARATDREALIAQIEKSGRLRGRGGAAFNTGFKWRSAFEVPSEKKYVICNADEGEPGTYKDRAIMESDPHTVLEGMAICAYAIGADEAIVYCRTEYPQAFELLKNAIEQAADTLAPVQFTLRSGAGAYVCGEETALLNSLEGLRGEPRLKPPYPTVAGLYGKPTVVNNVETFAAIPVIVEKGAAWYSAIGEAEYTGTKIFTLSGDLAHRGFVEAPSNTSLFELIYEFGGGVAGGKELKAVQVGGSSGAFLPSSALHAAASIETLQAVGGTLGSGAIFVLDETRSIADVVAQTVAFFRDESCGKCVPCREGTQRLSGLLAALLEGRGTIESLSRLEELARYIQLASFCPLGQSVATPVLSALQHFPDDFYALINEQRRA
jgi:NADH-quinone oxidoreductase subunit F